MVRGLETRALDVGLTLGRFYQRYTLFDARVFVERAFWSFPGVTFYICGTSQVTAGLCPAPAQGTSPLRIPSAAALLAALSFLQKRTIGIRSRWGCLPQTPAGLCPAPAQGTSPLRIPSAAALLAALSFLQKRTTRFEPPPRRRGIRCKAHYVPAIGSRRYHSAAEPISSSAAAIGCRLSLPGKFKRGSNWVQAQPAVAVVLTGRTRCR